MAALPLGKNVESRSVQESFGAELDALHTRLVSLEKRIRDQGEESRSTAPGHRISLGSKLGRLRKR